jgi:sugar-phosphatase
MTATTLTCRAILFDMDGTLVDSTEVVESVWERFADRFGLDVREILKTSHGRRMDDSIRRYGPADVDVAEVALDLTTFEYAADDGQVALPGAVDFMASLPADAIALVTSAGTRLARKRVGIAGITIPAVVVSADDVEHGKPHPEPYLRAARLLGVDPADAIVFEDADAGIQSGLAAGMRVVVVGEAAGEIATRLPRIHDYSGIRAEVTLDAAGRRLITLTVPG